VKPLFPYKMGMTMEDRIQTGEKTTRRSFLNMLLTVVLLIGLGGVIRTIFLFLWPSKEIVQGGAAGGPTSIPLNEIPVGGSKTVRYQGKPFVVVHTAAGIFAVSAVCTHLGCIVYWDKDKKVLACPCHAAFFALNGSVISGPPPSPLPVAQVKIVGEQIILS
jgi:cytochrome b6-f complex iron-sulfur subunit